MLAGLVAAEPDVLLLDEPTNNLDAEARALVARVLRGWKGGAVVISHDRALLREMDRIVEPSSLGARVYGGGYDLYAERRAAERAAAARELDTAERAAGQVERQAQAARGEQAKRDAAGRRKSGTAQAAEPKMVLDARERRAQKPPAAACLLAERQRAEADRGAGAPPAPMPARRLKTLAIALPPSGLAAGKRVLAFEDVGFAWPDGPPGGAGRDLRPRRPAPGGDLTGPNEAGKTTLLRLAVGDLEPTAGRIARGGRFALLDQRTAITCAAAARPSWPPIVG